MTAPRDPDQLIRAFLDEGRMELPDRAYDAVRGQIDRTRQRVVIGPWREPQMSNIAKIAIAAAAVVAVVVIGINLLPGGSGGVGGAPPTPTLAPATASPTPTLAPATPSQTPAPTSVSAADVGTELSGTYHVGEPFPVPFTITVPGNNLGSLNRGEVSIDRPGSSAVLGIYVPDGTYADPCLADASPQPAPTTVAGLVDAFAAMKGFTVESATDVTIDGHVGKSIVLSNSVTRDAGCRFGPDWVPIFTYVDDPPRGAATNPGATEYLWIVDVAGKPIVIATGSLARTFDELEPMAKTIDFDD